MWIKKKEIEQLSEFVKGYSSGEELDIRENKEGSLLKTPITSMMIMADLLEEAEPEKQTEFIHNIQVSLNKMEWLVGALLKMAKLDAHAIDFIKNDIHMSELLGGKTIGGNPFGYPQSDHRAETGLHHTL